MVLTSVRRCRRTARIGLHGPATTRASSPAPITSSSSPARPTLAAPRLSSARTLPARCPRLLPRLAWASRTSIRLRRIGTTSTTPSRPRQRGWRQRHSRHRRRHRRQRCKQRLAPTRVVVVHEEIKKCNSLVPWQAVRKPMGPGDGGGCIDEPPLPGAKPQAKP
jgi:hypothetical protein